ncbi:hypothetical protein [Microbacterium sp. GXF6406]
MAQRQPSSAVYRRRRIVFFTAVLVVIAIIGAGIWALVAQPWKDAGSDAGPAPSPSASETTTQTESPSAEPSPTETQGAAPCQAGSITVEAVTDAESYEAGALPQLSIRLTNTGAADCTIDVGSATQSFTVTSGEDVWWRSTDCQENPSSMVVTLTAGQSVSSATPVEWDRTRSDVGTCDQENRSRAPAGGASYHVAVSIGGFDAARTRQILLY